MTKRGPNPFAGYEPVDLDSIIRLLAIDYGAAFLLLLIVALAAYFGGRRQRRRPGLAARADRLGLRIGRPEYWGLPIYVWALETSLVTYKLHVFFREHGGNASFFLKILVFRAIFALCVLLALQVIAVMLVERERFGIGLRSHWRVAAIYAMVSVVLDAFFLLGTLHGRWPR